MTVHDMLQLLIQQEGSDLHIVAGVQPTLRVHGKLQPVPNTPLLTQAQVETLVTPLLSQEQLEYVKLHKELDFGGDDLKSQLQRQMELESEGIDLYMEHIASIDDEEVVGVLKHILDEERRHRKEFKMRLSKLEDL